MNPHVVFGPELSVLVLDYKKPEETRACLESIREHVKVPHKVIYLDNGGANDYAWMYYAEDRLCDVLISKREGRGGGYGQTDLFRFCDTKYALFVQNDQLLMRDIDDQTFSWLKTLINNGAHCIDLNGDQSRKGIWTDRAHMVETVFFNLLGPFPNGGPGNDAADWNEAHLQRIFRERDYKIAHVNPPFFADNGKWSVREAGDGLYKHRCDTKELWILKRPTQRTEVYPPFNDEEWARVFAGQWVDGDIPATWKSHSFRAFA